MSIVQKCNQCGLPLTDAIVRMTFEGFTTLALNGVTFSVHAGCVRLQVPQRDEPLPPRISDPEMDLVP